MLQVTSPNSSSPYVILIDDDTGMSKSIDFLLDVEKIKCILFGDGFDFMEAINNDAKILEGPGCIFLDVRMPNMNGLEVFDKLNANFHDLPMPVIFMTGHGDVPLVLKVLKEGAFDFIQKPFPAETLLQRLTDYFQESIRRRNLLLQKNEFHKKFDSLTGKEREVLEYLYEGMSNKQVAELMNNSVRTIELRRAAIYDKMDVKSTVELARLLQTVKWTKLDGDANSN